MVSMPILCEYNGNVSFHFEGVGKSNSDWEICMPNLCFEQCGRIEWRNEITWNMMTFSMFCLISLMTPRGIEMPLFQLITHRFARLTVMVKAELWWLETILLGLVAQVR